MLTKFHRDITRSMLAPYFTDEAVEIALRANDAQDNLRGQIAHPEYHVDNAVSPGYAFMLAQKQKAKEAFGRGDCVGAMEALGRCLHTVQDFYSHTTYVRIWLAEHGGLSADPESIVPALDWQAVPGLRTGRMTLREGLSYVPVAGRFFARVLAIPEDSHSALNLDGPHRGDEFAYALAAARKHSHLLVEEIWQEIAAEGTASTLPCVRR